MLFRSTARNTGARYIWSRAQGGLTASSNSARRSVSSHPAPLQTDHTRLGWAQRKVFRLHPAITKSTLPGPKHAMICQVNLQNFCSFTDNKDANDSSFQAPTTFSDIDHDKTSNNIDARTFKDSTKEPIIDNLSAKDRNRVGNEIRKIVVLSRSRQRRGVASAVENIMNSNVAGLLGPREFVVLMGCLQRSGFAKQGVMLHDQMVSLGVMPNIKTFSAAIRCCNTERVSPELRAVADDLYMEMTTFYNIKADLPIQHMRMGLARHYRPVVRILNDDIIAAGLRPSNATLSSLLAAGLYSRSYHKAVYKYDKIVRDYKLQPDLMARAQLLNALAGMESEERLRIEFQDMLRDLKQSICTPGARPQTGGNSLPEVVLTMLKTTEQFPHLWSWSLEILKVVENGACKADLGRPLCQLQARHYGLAIDACANAGQGVHAVDIYERAPEKIRLENGTLLARVMHANNKSNRALETLKLYSNIWDRLRLDKNPVERKRLARRGSNMLNKFFFEHAIEACADLKKSERSFKILGHMQQTLGMVSTFAVNGVLRGASFDPKLWPLSVKLYDQLMQNGTFRPNDHTFHILMKGYRLHKDHARTIDALDNRMASLLRAKAHNHTDLTFVVVLTNCKLCIIQFSFKQLDVHGKSPDDGMIRYYMMALLETNSLDDARSLAETYDAQRFASLATPGLHEIWVRAVKRLLDSSNKEFHDKKLLISAVDLWRQFQSLRATLQPNAHMQAGNKHLYDHEEMCLGLIEASEEQLNMLESQMLKSSKEIEHDENNDSAASNAIEESQFRWLQENVDELFRDLEWTREQITEIDCRGVGAADMLQGKTQK